MLLLALLAAAVCPAATRQVKRAEERRQTAGESVLKVEIEPKISK